MITFDTQTTRSWVVIVSKLGRKEFHSLREARKYATGLSHTYRIELHDRTIRTLEVSK